VQQIERVAMPNGRDFNAGWCSVLTSGVFGFASALLSVLRRWFNEWADGWHCHVLVTKSCCLGIKVVLTTIENSGLILILKYLMKTRKAI
jgi:hypothetical protein